MTAVLPRRLQIATICLGLTGLVSVVFGQTLRYGFISYDDPIYVYENPNITAGLSWHAVRWAFTHSHAANWHPLTTVSHMVDCQVYGLQPWGHHLTNLLLHLAATNLLFLLLWRLTAAPWRSATVAAIFAIHPLHVQSVAWIAERKDVLSALFFMLTLLAYVRYVKTTSVGRYTVVAALFCCGLMSKPMLVTAPLVLVLLDYWPLERFAGPSALSESKIGPARIRHAARLVLEKVPLLLVAAAASVLTIVVQREVIALHRAVPLGWRLGNVFVAYVIYIRQMFWPVDLALIYPYPDKPLPLLQTGSAFLFLTAISAAVFILRKRRPYLVTGWFWYLIMLLPVIGIVQVGPQAHADRYTYLPQVGLYIMMVWGIADALPERLSYRRLIAGATILVVGALAAVAWKQTSSWRDSQTLWEQTVAAEPANYDAQINLAIVLFRQGRIDDAVQHVEVAMHQSNRVPSDFAATHDALAGALLETGAVLVKQGAAAKAIPYLEAATKLLPPSDKDKEAQADYNLGAAFQYEGKVDEAISFYRKATEARPDYTDAYNNLANAFVQKGLYPEAMTAYGQALSSNPTSVLVRNNMAWQLATCPDPSFRDGAKAVALGEEAVRLSREPNEFVLHTLAAAYAQNQEFSKAIETARKARTLAADKNNARLVATLEREIASYESGSTFAK